MKYRIVWDNPYWLFSSKGKVECLHTRSILLSFDIDRKEDVLFFYDDKGCTKWLWKDRYKSGQWAKAHSGMLVDCENNLLARTECLAPNKIRTYRNIKSTVFHIFTQEGQRYAIEWKTTLVFGVMSQNDVMTLEDVDKQVFFESVDPPVFEFSIIKPSEENELLAKVFVAYHIKIPMVCIGE